MGHFIFRLNLGLLSFKPKFGLKPNECQKGGDTEVRF